MKNGREYKNRLPNGDAVIEFYSALDTIEEYYTKKGYRKISRLHTILKEKFNWKMPYDTFRYHFNKEFKFLEQKPKYEEELPQLSEEIETPKKKKPVITRTVEKHSFSTTSDIPDDRRL